VFPTNLGVNPQHTIMAVARLAASKIAETARPH
jgi:choline dehydrogenase-like flavoprotein